MATSLDTGVKPKGLAGKLGFSKKNFRSLLAVVLSGQLFYSTLEAMRGSFYPQLVQMLHVTNTQFGLLFTITAISSLLALPGGWIMNRYSTRSILVVCLLIRCATIAAIIYGHLSVVGLDIVACIWALIEAVYWPAILNGVALLSNSKNRNYAYSMLEWVRGLTQVILNVILVGLMTFASVEVGLHISQMGMFKFVLLIYNLLLIPLCVWIWRAIPQNGISASHEKGKNKDAMVGLGKVLKMPKIWIASLMGMSVYWASLNNNYGVAYLKNAFKMASGTSSLLGTVNSEGVRIIAALLSGFIAEKWLRSVAKTIGFSLILVAITNVLMAVLPKNPTTEGINITLLMISAFCMFSAKAIFTVPIARIPMPEKYRGSAMGIDTFVAYLPMMFAMVIGGHLLDTFKPDVAFSDLWIVNAVVTFVGALLCIVIRHWEKQDESSRKTAETVKN